MLLKTECPKCGATAKEKNSITLGKNIIKTYFCGHIETVPLISGNGSNIKPQVQEEIKVPEPTQKELYENLDRWVSEGGSVKISDKELQEIEDFMSYHNLSLSKRARDYQVAGVKFAEAGNCRVLFADEMGVGKTIEALVTLKRNKKYLFPFLALVPSSTTVQWMYQYHDWISDKAFDILPIFDRNLIYPGANGYLMSRDLLSRKGILDKVNKLGIKLLIVDECHAFKDMSSQRTKALIQCIQDNDIKYLIFLSGTPIKNSADEYYPILNLLDPARFYSRDSFRREFLIQETDGRGKPIPKWTKIKPSKQALFQEITSRYIIRRTKEEVLPELPKLTRDWQFIEITDPALRNSYNETLTLMGNFMKNTAKINTSQILGWLAKLRSITGMAKCPNVVEWVEDFLESTEEKIIIGIHHQDVRDTLFNAFKIKGIGVLKLSGEDDQIKKYNIVQEFNKPENRVLVIQNLSGGVGLDGLQTCPNLLVVEREWNHADEEQLEGRVHRYGQLLGVIASYLIAIGTIDEFFHKMVYEKSHNTASAGIGEGRDITTSLSFLKEFAEFLAEKKL